MFNCSIILNQFIVKCMNTQRLAYMVYVCDFFFFFISFLFFLLLAVLCMCVCRSERSEREYDFGAIRVILSYWNIKSYAKNVLSHPWIKYRLYQEVTITFLDFIMFIIKDILICWFDCCFIVLLRMFV